MKQYFYRGFFEEELTTPVEEQADSALTASADMMSAVSGNAETGVAFGSASNLVQPGESNMAPVIGDESLSAAGRQPEEELEQELELEADVENRSSTPEPLQPHRAVMSTPVDGASTHALLGAAMPSPSGFPHLSSIAEASVELDEQSAVPIMNSTACEHSATLDIAASAIDTADVQPMSIAGDWSDGELEAIRLRFPSPSTCSAACCVEHAVQTETATGCSLTSHDAAAQVEMDCITQSAVRAAAEEIVAAVRSSCLMPAPPAGSMRRWMPLVSSALLLSGVLLLVLLTFFYDEYQTGYNGRHLSFLRTAQHWTSHMFHAAPPL